MSFSIGDKVTRCAGGRNSMWSNKCKAAGVLPAGEFTVASSADGNLSLKELPNANIAWAESFFVLASAPLRPRTAGEWNRCAAASSESFARHMAEFASELEGELDAAGRPCDTCGCRDPKATPESECPRCYAEMQWQQAAQDLQDIEAWNDATVPTIFDTHMDKVMGLLHNRREKAQIVDLLAGLMRTKAMAVALAGELIAAIRINVMRSTFKETSIEQVDEWLKPFCQRLADCNMSVKIQPTKKSKA